MHSGVNNFSEMCLIIRREDVAGEWEGEARCGRLILEWFRGHDKGDLDGPCLYIYISWDKNILRSNWKIFI